MPLDMLLSSIRLVGLGPFDDLVITMTDGNGAPRKAVVVLGAAGVGKTSLLLAVASTRPGFAVALNRPRSAEPHRSSFVVADWMLGDDDPARPHPLRVTSPNVVLDESEESSQLRRREQSLFDRKAQERGFALVSFSAARWFSRSPVVLTSPERSVFRYDVRAAPAFDDAGRADLARDTKQALSYAAIAAALSRQTEAHEVRQAGRDLEQLDRAMREVVGRLTELAGFRYLGADPVSLEPLFENERGGSVDFDNLPNGARHLAAFGALTMRTLQAAWPGRDVRQAEGVVLIDDVGLHQDIGVQQAIVPALREVLPRVQWLLTTSSPVVAAACDASEVIALRRMPSSQRVELYEGPLATLH